MLSYFVTCYWGTQFEILWLRVQYMYAAAVICSKFHTFDEAVAAWSGFGRLKIADCMPYTGLIASQLADAPRSIHVPMSLSLPASANIQTLLQTLVKVSVFYYRGLLYKVPLWSPINTMCLSVGLSPNPIHLSYLNANLTFTRYTPTDNTETWPRCFPLTSYELHWLILGK